MYGFSQTGEPRNGSFRIHRSAMFFRVPIFRHTRESRFFRRHLLKPILTCSGKPMRACLKRQKMDEDGFLQPQFLKHDSSLSFLHVLSLASNSSPTSLNKFGHCVSFLPESRFETNNASYFRSHGNRGNCKIVFLLSAQVDGSPNSVSTLRGSYGRR